MSSSAGSLEARTPELDLTTIGATRGGESRWLLAGVAADLGDRLAVSPDFIRGLLVLASLLQRDVLFAYLLVALVLPRAGRRTPGPVNLIAVVRVGLAFALLWGLAGGGVSLDPGLFDAGPAVWITQCGVCLVGLLALLATGVPARERDPVRDRQSVLAGGPLIGLVAVVAVGVVFVPAVRWDRALGAIAAIGGLAILGGRRGAMAGLVAPAALIAAAALLFAGAGVRLDGGVGDARIVATDPATVPSTYRRAIGDLTIDLSGLSQSTRPVVVQASVGIGALVIDVPAGAQVSAVERVGRGRLIERGSLGLGFDLRSSPLAGAVDLRTGRPLSGQPPLRLRIVADVGIGSLDIERTDPRLGDFGAL